MKKETVIGLRTGKAAIQDYGGVAKVPITLDLVKDTENSYTLYNEHLRKEQAQKRQKEAERLRQEAHKRKMEEIKLKRNAYMQNLKN